MPTQIDLARLLSKSDSEPVVFGLDGAWGIGKSHWWKHSSSCDAAIYLSTFRIATVRELESKLATELLATKFSPTENRLQRLLREGFGYSKNFLLGYLETKTGGRAPDGLIERLVLREFFGGDLRTVCFDDVERTSIPIREFFGYIDYLRDQWGINVVLIYNSGQFHPNNKEDFENFREKGLDREFRFQQPIENSAKIALTSEPAAVSEAFTLLCVKHDIANIRVIRRAKHLSEELRVTQLTDSGAIFSQILETILLACSIKFEKSFSPIKLEDLKDPRFLFRNRQDEESEIGKARKELVERWGYLNDIDRMLIGFVDNDEIDLQRLTEQIRASAETTLMRAQEAELTKVFQEFFRKNFADTSESFVRGVLAHAEKYADRKWPINHVNNVVSVLHRLGLTKEVDEILNKQIQEKYSSEEVAGWRTSVSAPLDVCEPLAVLLDNIDAAFSDQRSLLEVLSRVAEMDGFNINDIPRLAEFSDADWEAFFKGDVASPQRVAQLFLSSNLDIPHFQDVQQTITRVLTQISQESEFNRIRIQQILPPEGGT